MTTSPGADPRAVVQGPGFRFTLLTSRLIRMERSDDGSFTDEATQLVQNRRFAVPEFTTTETAESLDIFTEHLHVRYEKGPCTGAGLSVTMRTRAQGSHRTTWHPGDSLTFPAGRDGNLGGTARTLDDVDGPIALEPGLLSRHGYAVVDDSGSLELTDDGWIAPRHGAEEDLYFFGYGLDFQGALRDYFRLTGPSPLLPRWTLGNWWSRYHRYDADEYLALMDRFASEGIPFSVAVLDMDWHLVDIDPVLGNGWTGYTWNPDLFPDPSALLAALHERGLHVTLNVHPADGVRRHEEAYEDMALDLGLEPATGLEIAFDLTSREFAATYLARLHHPHEAIGVDFWWLDWQSGTNSHMPGLDPLWMLNHVHYRDSARGGNRPLTLSRYSGLGSHRYPIGFSGDTVATWASLDFQPYFTATAANVGYFWWSHDVGGHLGGAKDHELAIRWYQLGVFSPINRLHSSSSPFNSKEPWRYGAQAELIATRFLRLRHQLVPYLYSAMWESHTDGVAPVRPMYHDYPQARAAYDVPNQFMFGPDLLVAPITTPVDRHTGLGQVTAWLPPGTWFDLSTGRRYDGDRPLRFHRSLAELPVLARAGTIVPLAGDTMADPSANPSALALRVVPCADGGCTLLEDDGRGSPSPQDRHQTAITLTWLSGVAAADGAEVVLTIAPPSGPGVLTRRTLTVELIGVESVGRALVRAGTHEAEPRPAGAPGVGAGPAVIELGSVDLSGGLELRLIGVRLREPSVAADCFTVVDDAEMLYDLKTGVFNVIESGLVGAALLAALDVLELPGNLFAALTEIIAAGGAGR